MFTMHTLEENLENWYALYVAIIKNYSVEESFMKMYPNVVVKNVKSPPRNIMSDSELDEIYKLYISGTSYEEIAKR